MTDNTKAYDHVAYELLTRAHPPELASTLFVDKVLHKPLSLRPTSPDPHSQDARAARRLKRLRKKEHLLKRQKPKPFSAKEKRALGLYEIPKAQQKYELYLGLHQLWLGYMQEILGLYANREPHVTSQSMGPILASADYHGCILEVVRSRCVGRVGCRGIVLKDTKFTFEIITEQNVLKSRHSI
jgi:ribonuclease P protein subunit POP4